MPTPRAQARTRTLAEITRIGREHLATQGAAGLSLRAVARDLGVVSSAVYRYVPSRDDLLTLLVVDAYAELAERVTEAEAEEAREDHTARWRAICAAVRNWARAEPSRYGLIFGTPVPGYHAPAEQTTPPGTAVIVLLLLLAQDAEAGGAVPLGAGATLDPGLLGDVERIRTAYELTLSPQMLTAVSLAWVAVFGAVSFEVFGQYGADTFAAPDMLFAAQVDLLAGLLGLTSPSAVD